VPDNLARQLGLPAATALVVGQVIAVGIFLTPGGRWARFSSVTDRTEGLRWTDAVVVTATETMAKTALGAIDRIFPAVYATALFSFHRIVRLIFGSTT
jgi:hypothetical protein